MKDQVEGEVAGENRAPLGRWDRLLTRQASNPRTLWGRMPLASLCLGILGLGIFVSIFLTHRNHGSLDHLPAAGWLLLVGGFMLFGSLAMWGRVDYAESYGEPDPYAPPGYHRDKLSWWGRNELQNAPLYEGAAWIFTALGVALLVASGITEVVVLLT